MTSATIRIGDVVTPQRRQDHLAETNSGIIAHRQSTERALAERHGHEVWAQGIEQAWHGHLESLQQCLCELLLKNQQLRMALKAVNGAQRGDPDGGGR